MNQQPLSSMSGEKRSPNESNLQPYQPVDICACGKVVIARPITLPCGHRFHFKCARTLIFTKDTDENEEEGGGECPLCIQSELFQQTSSEKTSTQEANTIENSFKYFTPSSNKYPKRQLRYSGCSQESFSTQHPSTNFMISPPVITQPRIPFTDITSHFKQFKTDSQTQKKQQHQQIKQQDSDSPKLPLKIAVLEQEKCKPYRIKSQHLIEVLSQSVLKSAQLESNLKNKDDYCSSIKGSHSSLQFSQNISGIEVKSSYSDKDSLSIYASSSSEINGSFLKMSKDDQILTKNKLKLAYDNASINENSFENASVESNKENIRCITKKRKNNGTLQVSLLEGLSFLCESNLYNENKEYQLPFIMQLQNIQNENDLKQKDNSLELVLIIVHNHFTSQQRYQIIQYIFDLLSTQDQISLAWIDANNNNNNNKNNNKEYILYKNQSDYFADTQFKEVFSKEFMRLQCNYESAVQLSGFQETNQLNEYKEAKGIQLQQFISQQFASSQNKSMIQQAMIIGPASFIDLVKKQNQNDERNNAYFSLIEYECNELSQKLNNQELNSLFQQINQQIAQSRLISIKNIQIEFTLNPYLTHFKGISLLNSNQLNAQVSSSITFATSVGPQMYNSDLIDEQKKEFETVEEKSDKIAIYTVKINYLVASKIDLLFMGAFSNGSDSVYNSARIFNCLINYQLISSQNNMPTLSNNSDSINSSPFYSNSFVPSFLSNYTLNNIYMLVEWRKDESHLKYSKEVALLFWKQEVFTKHKDKKADIFNKYKQIFEFIAKNKTLTEIEEFKEFMSYYSLH